MGNYGNFSTYFTWCTDVKLKHNKIIFIIHLYFVQHTHSFSLHQVYVTSHAFLITTSEQTAKFVFLSLTIAEILHCIFHFCGQTQDHLSYTYDFFLHVFHLLTALFRLLSLVYVIADTRWRTDRSLSLRFLLICRTHLFGFLVRHASIRKRTQWAPQVSAESSCSWIRFLCHLKGVERSKKDRNSTLSGGKPNESK